MFPTFIFLISSNVSPIPNMRILPIRDIWLIISAVSHGFTKTANRVMLPWYTKTGIAEKATPIPIVAAKMIALTPSRIDFANKVFVCNKRVGGFF